jgi:hypothetical protein
MPFLGQWFCCGSSLTFSLRSFAGFADTSPHHFLSFASPRPGPESGRPMRQCEVPALRVSAVSQPPVGQYPSRVDQILFYSACRFLWVLPGAERLVLKWKRRVVSVGMARYGSSVPRDESDDHQIWSQMGLDQFDPYCTYYLTYCTIHNIYIYRLYLMVTELGRVLIPRSWVQRHFVMPYDTTQQRKFFRKHTRHPRKLAW